MSVVISVRMSPPASTAGTCVASSSTLVKGSSAKNQSQLEEKKMGITQEHAMEEEEELKQGDNDGSLLRQLLEKHGSPENPSDQYKALEQIMLDSERDICIFAGALELLAHQREESRAGKACSVCTRDFTERQDLESCIDQIEIKMRETEMARDECQVVKVYHTAQRALTRSSPTPASEGKMFESRVAFNMRSGALTELRNQKAECLHDQRCFACLRPFVGSDISIYLQRVDRNAFQMQERLHVHR